MTETKQQTVDPNCLCGHAKEAHSRPSLDGFVIPLCTGNCACPGYRQAPTDAEQPKQPHGFDGTCETGDCGPKPTAEQVWKDTRAVLSNSLAAPSPSDDDRDAAGDVRLAWQTPVRYDEERGRLLDANSMIIADYNVYGEDSKIDTIGNQLAYVLNSFAAERERTHTLVSALTYIERYVDANCEASERIGDPSRRAAFHFDAMGVIREMVREAKGESL